MGNRIDLIPPDCQILHYCYDLPACLRYAFIEKDSHLVEAVRSRLPFEPIDTFYWRENVLDADFKREQLRLDAEVMDNGGVRMEVHPGLFLHPEVIDLESVWFGIVGKGWGPGDFIRLSEIGFIWVMAFLRDLSTAEILEDKLIIHRKVHEIPEEFQEPEKKAVPAAPEKEAKVGRPDVPPRDVVKYAKEKGVKRSSLVILRGLYRGSWWGNSSKLWVWHEPKHRDGRWNTGGVDGLVDRTGLCEKTVRSGLKELREARVIYRRHYGRPGEGNSIYELPKKKGHIMAWKRKPKHPKK